MIYDTTLRLHVIANSDSEDDQRVKLLVRDAVLKSISEYGPTTKEEALTLIYSEKEAIESAANEVLQKNGKSERATLMVGRESYPVRRYEGFSMPAGTYTSGRVVIGEGKGENWWCVLYPPLCTSYSIEADDDEYVDVGLSKDQYNMITGSDAKYKVKFKLLEIAAEAIGLLRSAE